MVPNVGAIYEPDAEMAAAASALAPDANMAESLDALLDDRSLDCLLIVSPNHLSCRNSLKPSPQR